MKINLRNVYDGLKLEDAEPWKKNYLRYQG